MALRHCLFLIGAQLGCAEHHERAKSHAADNDDTLGAGAEACFVDGDIVVDDVGRGGKAEFGGIESGTFQHKGVRDEAETVIERNAGVGAVAIDIDGDIIAGIAGAGGGAGLILSPDDGQYAMLGGVGVVGAIDLQGAGGVVGDFVVLLRVEAPVAVPLVNEVVVVAEGDRGSICG